jgi:hypothetical protein
MWYIESTTLTEKQKEQYEKYVQEWEFRKNSSRIGCPDWGISNGQGDPFSTDEWLRRPQLHYFEGAY